MTCLDGDGLTNGLLVLVVVADNGRVDFLSQRPRIFVSVSLGVLERLDKETKRRKTTATNGMDPKAEIVCVCVSMVNLNSCTLQCCVASTNHDISVRYANACVFVSVCVCVLTPIRRRVHVGTPAVSPSTVAIATRLPVGSALCWRSCYYFLLRFLCAGVYILGWLV